MNVTYPQPTHDPFADSRAAGETGLAIVAAGKSWVVVELPGELVSLGDWSFFRAPSTVYGPATYDQCETYLGTRIAGRLKVGRFAPVDETGIDRKPS